MIGARVGGWVIDGELGAGPTGTVYRGRRLDPAADAPDRVAIKVLTHPNALLPGFVQKFPAEVLALRRLTHPNVARVFESGTHAGRPFVASELAEGVDLGTLLGRNEKLDLAATVLNAAVQAARALKHAHHRGILHRGLAPSDLILAPDGRLKVTDFGLAKILSIPPLSLPDDPFGAAAFLAPEHYTGKPVTRRSDLYALGGVLYALATGRPPFATASAAERMHKHCYALPERPANLVPKLPAEFDELLCALLAKDPNRRPASAAAVLEELDRVRAKLERRGDTVALPPDKEDPTGVHSPLVVPSTDEKAEAEEHRSKLRRGLLLGAALAAVLGVMGYLFFRPHPPAAALLAAALPLVESDDPADWDRAVDEYLTPMASRHPDELTAERESARQRVRDRKELRRATADGANAKYSTEAERLYQRGLRLAQAGEFGLARLTWQAVTVGFAGSEADRRHVQLSEAGLAELAKQRTPRPTPGPAEALAAVRRLRADGKTAAADDMMRALELLYRDQPEALSGR